MRVCIGVYVCYCACNFTPGAHWKNLRTVLQGLQDLTPATPVQDTDTRPRPSLLPQGLRVKSFLASRAPTALLTQLFNDCFLLSRAPRKDVPQDPPEVPRQIPVGPMRVLIVGARHVVREGCDPFGLLVQGPQEVLLIIIHLCRASRVMSWLRELIEQHPRMVDPIVHVQRVLTIAAVD